MSKNWELKTLDEVCDNLDNKRIPITKSKRDSGDIPYYGASGIVDYVKDFIFDDDLLLVSEDGANLLARTYPIAFGVSGKCWVNNHAHILKFENSTNQKYVEYYLNSIKLDKYITGMAQPKLNKKMLNSIEIPYPLVEEQIEIVKILDKAFESIEKAKINIEKNLQNTKDLFSSRLNEIFSQKGDGWDDKKLEDLANEKKAIVSGPFGSNLKVADYRDSGVPILRLQNVGKGIFIEKAIKYIEKEKAEELKSHSYVVGDIVLAKLGIPIGKTCIIPDTFNDGIILADIVRIRPDKNIVNYKYLEYFLNTELSVSQLTKEISGATRPRVNLSNVRSIIVPIPSLETQNTLLIEINKLSEQTKKLEKQYQQKLDNLEELKKSILEKAFSGELLK